MKYWNNPPSTDNVDVFPDNVALFIINRWYLGTVGPYEDKLSLYEHRTAVIGNRKVYSSHISIILLRILAKYESFCDRLGLTCISDKVHYLRRTSRYSKRTPVRTRYSYLCAGEQNIRSVLLYRKLLKQYGIKDPIAYEGK
jgi:hypothetical protein